MFVNNLDRLSQHRIQSVQRLGIGLALAERHDGEVKIPVISHLLRPLQSLLELPMDSASTSAELDKIDLGDFQADERCSQGNAAILASLATAAYASRKDQVAHLDQQEDITSYSLLDSKNNASLGIPQPHTGTQLTVVETKDALLVAARGTSPPWLANLGKDNHMEWRDYVADLAAVPVPNFAGNARVHAGFKQAAEGIWGQLQPLVKIALETHKAIHFTGHSLGAAIALHLADKMHQETGLLPTSVLRFGGPDVGWGGHQKHLEDSGLADRTVNFVNNNDPVPHVLPGGKSAGSEVYFDRHGLAHLDGSTALDHLLGAAGNTLAGKFNPVFDHVPGFYAEAVRDPRNRELLDGL